MTAPSAPAGARAVEHGGMVLGGATTGVMHEQPFSGEKPHGGVVQTGRLPYGIRSGQRSASVTPKDQSAVTDMNSGQQTRPSSSQQRHVAYSEEPYTALQRSVVPTSSIDSETSSPPHSMESRYQANQVRQVTNSSMSSRRRGEANYVHPSTSPGQGLWEMPGPVAGNVVAHTTVPKVRVFVVIRL
jgi:hypothetical protein